MIHAQVHRKPDSSIGELKISVTEESIPDFTALINRALNCWDSAPKDLKELGDLITHGRITQDHTPTRINTHQNSEYHSPEEYALIEEFIREHGQAAWLQRINNQTTSAVLRGEAKD